MKIIILKTQSFSDIITNSSSELFVVKGDRYSSAFEDFLYVENIGDLQWYLERKEILLPEIRKYLKEIYQILDSIVGYRQEPEIDVCINYCSKSNIEESELKSQFYKELPDKWIEVDYPYCKNSVKEFYISGFEGILNKKIGKANYKIRYYLGD